ncbi:MULTISPECIES: signal peptidase II [unclassified Agarivorans]|uniref:signal peptidase II n=1 Tax=unclassified Agarivorans TaxID=2636026 RepID=UPI0010EE7B1F|nr:MULTISPECIES: signal peptidase II [unclassified Agarivorans]MDO6685083.1 signal peptidase II [Agarivorans sp. 3_MG-2023]MDO6715745.1 signal peptidase II [Agarivorans sp. 2_MG-2023]MDO6763896.1 signal peptidase II [Agarivorans sp. 1_MG-2023]GDY27791.1 lipoprotein signal peptidase [Agarivorans sp. Toyoura001]
MHNEAVANKTSSTGLRWLWLSVVVFALDQITKLAIAKTFDLYERVEVTPFFNLVSVRNYGAAFSFLSDAGGWQRWFFTAIAIFVSGLLLWWMKKTPANQKWQAIAYALVLGGAIGNVVDRVVFGYVIDFLDFYVGSYHWPSFNVADSAICVGAVLLVLDSIFSPQPKDAK